MNLENLSATQLGELVNKKKISPVEVIEYFRNRITARNASINAFTYLNIVDAREEAKKLEARIMKGEDVGPLAGVPIALKDFLPTKKGWPATHGGVPSLKTIDDADSEFYKAARRLGCIAVGKTNAPAFGFRGTTDNVMFGPTSTPFNTEYNSGGSSGGSCAAVGDRLVTLAECGDAGGSTRIPSAWCLCFGFKPSAGLVPSVCRPDAWTATHPYCCGGPASRTVEDAAIIMEAMMAYDPKDPISVPLPHKQFSTLMNEGVSGLRVAVTYDYNLFKGRVDPQIISAVDNAAKVLADNGATVEHVDFSFSHELAEMENSWFLGISIDTAIDLEFMKYNGLDLLDDHADELPANFIYWTKEAFKSTMLDYREFHEIRTDILDAHLEIFRNHDVILSPVSCCMPVRNSNDRDTKGPDELFGIKCEPLLGFAQTWLQNMTGNPAASVPAGLGRENLPIGVQVVGRRYFDEDVFKVARVLEKNIPWVHLYEVAENREL